MSGRGRGRGRGRGAAPPSVASAPAFSAPAVSVPLGPAPCFPETLLPEPVDPTVDELIAINFSDELADSMLTSPYHLVAKDSKEHRIDRYSDKYMARLQVQDRKGKIHTIVTDLTFFPEELHAVYNPEKAQKFASAMANTKMARTVSFTDTLARLKDLEAREEQTGSPDGHEEREKDDEEDEVVYEEDELEDETDYNMSYFDDGEEYGDYDDGDGNADA